MTINVSGQGKTHAFEISKNLDIYATLFKELNSNYVDEIQPGELNTAALNAMLKTLDPYTIYIPESKVEDVKFLTTGEYGGIGVSVIKRDGKVYISSIESDTPALEAGLLAGDEIISVDEQLLSERSGEEISKLLKGQPGTSISLKVHSLGAESTVEKVVFRKNINVEAVPYYGMIDSTIAYINLTSFTKGASVKVVNAFRELEKENPEALIFDLRGNGGGLIGEAVNIMNIFIPKGEEVVRTKGRLREKNYIYKTRNAAIDTIIPIVFLVDKNSASASEILSGATQDLDRGLIIGERTFGKGLVQNVIPLSFNAQMKVTIAKYYIPSGRCVQAIDYSHKDDDGVPIIVNDSLLEEFKTRNGRSVYDGRGIKPDILLKRNKLSDISVAMIENFMFFDFCNNYRLENDNFISAEDFVISDELWQSFEKYVKDKGVDYKTDLDKRLEAFKKQIERDSLTSELGTLCEQMEKQIASKKEGEFDENKDEIKRILKTDLVSRYFFSRGVIIANLHQDKAIAKAKEILLNKSEYNRLLNK